MQLIRVSEDVTWYLGWLDDVKRSFNALSFRSNLPDVPEWTFIRNKGQGQDDKDPLLGVGGYTSTRYELEKALKQDPKRCAASRCRRIPNARPGHVTAFLQVCRQHACTRNTCVL